MNTLDIVKQGVEAHLEGDLQTAASRYQDALAEEDSSPLAHNNLGFALGQMARWPEAESHLREALRLDNGMAVAHANLGQVLAAMGNTDEAIVHLRRSVDIAPDDAGHWNNLARVQFRCGLWQEAEYSWQRVLNLEPGSVTTMVRLATALVAQQRLDDAHRWFEQAIRVHPCYAEAWAQKGVTLFMQQNFGGSKQALARAIAIDPLDLQSRKHLALAHLACGERKQAMVQYRKILQLLPEDPDIICDLAVLELSNGNKKAACDRLGGLVESRRDTRFLYYYAVSLRETRGAKRRIRSLLREIIKRDDRYRKRAQTCLDAL